MNSSLIIHAICGLLLLVIPVGVLYLWDKKLLRTFGVAVARMIGQLLVVCLMVWALFRYDYLALHLGWLVLLACYTAAVVLIRLKLNVGRFLWPVAVGQLVGMLLPGFYLRVAVLPLDNSLYTTWFVPVMALLAGHTTASQIRGLGTYFSALKVDEQEYEYRRGNGKNHLQALIPFVKRAVQSILSPASANLAVMGLFTLPLLLCGLLLSGMEPLTAFVVMVSLTSACVAASVVALIVSLWLCDGKLFDKFGKLTLMVAMLLVCASCEAQSPKTVMYELPAPLKDRPEQILQRKGYTTSYNRDTRNPNWVAWHLTKEHTKGKNQRKEMVFTEDQDVKPRATNNDYYNSRYDRGHMCPAGDNKWDKEAMTQSFLFTNICPQNHGLNKYEWNELEIKCREWAKEYGAIDIVCGPIYDAEDQRTIGKNKVWVPVAFFKVVLCRKGIPKAIGFIYRNEGKRQTMKEAVRTVDDIEALTGIDFFPALDDATENRIEARAKLYEW
jgi:endonuclease G